MPSTIRTFTRSLPLALLLGTALVLGAGLLPSGPAHGADEDEEVVKASDVKALREQVAALQKQVEYLRSRETALTAYVLANDVRGAALQKSMAISRDQGFLKRAIPENSRTALLEGLIDLGRTMRAELPEVTGEQARMRKQADAATRRAGSAD